MYVMRREEEYVRRRVMGSVSRGRERKEDRSGVDGQDRAWIDEEAREYWANERESRQHIEAIS